MSNPIETHPLNDTPSADVVIRNADGVEATVNAWRADDGVWVLDRSAGFVQVIHDCEFQAAEWMIVSNQYQESSSAN